MKQTNANISYYKNLLEEQKHDLAKIRKILVDMISKLKEEVIQEDNKKTEEMPKTKANDIFKTLCKLSLTLLKLIPIELEIASKCMTKNQLESIFEEPPEEVLEADDLEILENYSKRIIDNYLANLA